MGSHLAHECLGVGISLEAQSAEEVPDVSQEDEDPVPEVRQDRLHQRRLRERLMRPRSRWFAHGWLADSTGGAIWLRFGHFLDLYIHTHKMLFRSCRLYEIGRVSRHAQSRMRRGPGEIFSPLNNYPRVGNR